MVIFRENTEDIYAGIEWRGGNARGARRSSTSCSEEMGVKKIRFPETSGIGIKPVSREGTSGWSARRSSTRSTTKRQSVTLVHKGNIMKFTEGGFRDWGYELGQDGVRRDEVDRRDELRTASRRRQDRASRT